MKIDPNGSVIHRRADFSPCRRYRYLLWRAWSADRAGADGRFVMFVGLNPSTADEVRDDPTIRRCIAFARAWGFSALCVTNLFAYRATEPADMLAQRDPVGPENDEAIAQNAAKASLIVAAWGVHGEHRGRASEVKQRLPRLHCLRLTKNGHPQHPLYLPGTLQPVEWTSAAVNAGRLVSSDA